MQLSLDFSRPRRPYQYHSCVLVKRLRELQPKPTPRRAK